MKYILAKIGTNKFFKGYEKTNRPTWTENPFEAVQYNEQQALQTQRRLACQQQKVKLSLLNRLLYE